jgi:flagellar protein FliJ
MADLNPLIRYRKFEVEEKQKFLAQLYREFEMLENHKLGLLKDIERERKLIENDEDNIEQRGAYLLYVDRVRIKLAEIEEAQKFLNQKIEKAQDEVREAFADMKKIQIIQERRDEEEEREINAKESRSLDEIGITLTERRRREEAEG